MKRLSALSVVSVVFVLLLALPLLAQRPGGGGGTVNRPPTTSNPATGLGTRSPLSVPEIERPIFVSGKVVLSDGTQITEPAAVVTVCGNRRRVEAYTDSHGSFSFELKKKSNMGGAQSAEMSSSNDLDIPKGSSTMQFRGCEIQAVLPGFSSDSVQLAISMSGLETTDVGRIVLRRMGNVDGSILSVTSLAAPDSARKAFEKAHEQEKKNKLDDARASLQKAVDIYPAYAAAWSDLGRLQHANHASADARHSFEQALAADPKYAKPYLGLAQLAAESKEWKTLIDVTSKFLALNSVDFPMAWFLNGIGHFNLQEYDAAEVSARGGVKVDTEHHFPRLEYLLGILLAKKHDYPQAADHLRQYKNFSTQPEDIAEAQKQLAQIEQMSATVGSPQAAPPK